MNICIVDRGSCIPAKKYGGTERVIWGLGKSLHELGHKVTFIVRAGSQCHFADVIARNEELDLNDQIPAGTDVVHMNYQPLTPLDKPYIVTMHGNPSAEESLDHNMVFISKNQAERHNSEVYIHNGLDWSEYPQPDLSKIRSYVHFLGKASWKVKNVFGATAIAKEAKEKIYVIGGKRWTSSNIKRGFSALIDKNVKFCGMLDDKEKTRIMEQSRALIFPVNWHEPFGLAVIESLYAGCAVFGSRNGSLPELISPEVGFCRPSTSELVEAMGRFSFNPEVCHKYATEKFNAMTMTLKYLTVYKEVIEGKKLNETAPRYNPAKNHVEKFIRNGNR